MKITEQSDESGATVTCLCLVSCHMVHAMYYQDDTLIYSKHLLHSLVFPVIFYLIVIGVGVGLTMAYLHLLSSFCEMSLCCGLTESVKTMTITLFRVSPFSLLWIQSSTFQYFEHHQLLPTWTLVSTKFNVCRNSRYRPDHWNLLTQWEKVQ